MKTGRFKWGERTYVMGIINVTPDSFSGDGLAVTRGWIKKVVSLAKQFSVDGADIIDIGGESSRPGSKPVTAEVEAARVIPAVGAVRQAVDLPISVDTYRSHVAERALAAGAEWINDIWGLRMDPDMAEVVARAGCGLVIMHNRSKPRQFGHDKQIGGSYSGAQYDDLIADIKRELLESVELALSAGVAKANIIVDPGIGFGKSVSQNIALLRRLDQFRILGYPVLIGPSRKSFIGHVLNLPPSERLEGTAATVAIGIDRGADIIRVHDVKAMVRVARMTDRIVRIQT